MTSLPIDVSVRERIRNEYRSSTFVQAGAGTGKTTEMVQRIVRLIVAGEVEITSIVAITFTEKAAGELRERIRRELERVASDSDARDTERERCRAAVGAIDEAPIQTIHAFSQRLLQAFPIEAGLPPTFTAIDGVGARLAFQRRWQRFMARTVASDVEQPHDEVLRVALGLGMTTRQFRGLAELCENDSDRVIAWASSSALVRPHAPQLKALFDLFDLIDEQTRRCLDQSDKLYVLLSSQLGAWRDVLSLAADDELETLIALNDMPALKVGRLGQKANWPGDSKTRASELVEQLKSERSNLLQPTQQWVLDGLLRVTVEFVAEGVAQRRREGVLQFHDLLVFARDLLASSSHVLREVRRRYRFVLVDEFQDTDPVQTEIISLLTSLDGSVPGSLFTVGDPKQSIYRFRNADPAEYAAMRNRASEVLDLTANFRTLPAVVDWVNQTFARLLGEAEREWVSLDAAREVSELLGDGSVVVFGDVQVRRSMTSAEVRQLEATDIVDRIVSALDSGWMVEDRGSYRPVRLNDIAVLMPTRVALPSLERALRARSVPYRVESRSLIWATQEVRDVLNIAAAVQDPSDEVALVGALRSPAFGCSDRELLQWVAEGGRWDYRQDVPAAVASSLVAQGMSALRALHDKHWWKTASETIGDIIRTRQMFELAFGYERQREVWARLRFLIDQSRAWGDEHTTGLRGFVQWAKTQADENADALEFVVPDGDDDAVRVMTIHASKGLEFPVVFVTGLNSSPSNADTVRLLWADDNQPCIRLGAAALGFETVGFSELAERDGVEDMQERLRLLYVAATRARDHLLISVHRVEKSDLLSSMLTKVLPDDSYSVGSPVVADSAVPDETVVDAPVVDWPDLAARRASALRRGAAPGVVSATEMTRLMNQSPPLESVLATDSVEDRNELLERLAFGRVVHRVLELVQPDSEANIDELAEAIAGAEGFSHRSAEAAVVVRQALQSRPFREAVDSGRWWKELSVAADIGGVVANGSVDLVYERDGELVVVDYKTDPVTSQAEAMERLRHYQWQLLIYVGALQRATGKRVAEASLLFVSAGLSKPIVVSLEDLPGAERQLELQLHSIAHPMS